MRQTILNPRCYLQNWNVREWRNNEGGPPRPEAIPPSHVAPGATISGAAQFPGLWKFHWVFICPPDSCVRAVFFFIRKCYRSLYSIHPFWYDLGSPFFIYAGWWEKKCFWHIIIWHWHLWLIFCYNCAHIILKSQRFFNKVCFEILEKMPFGYECRSRIFKQVPAQPTIRTRPISKELPTPGPNEYEQPQLCGKYIFLINVIITFFYLLC